MFLKLNFLLVKVKDKLYFENSFPIKRIKISLTNIDLLQDYQINNRLILTHVSVFYM